MSGRAQSYQLLNMAQGKSCAAERNPNPGTAHCCGSTAAPWTCERWRPQAERVAAQRRQLRVQMLSTTAGAGGAGERLSPRSAATTRTSPDSRLASAAVLTRRCRCR